MPQNTAVPIERVHRGRIPRRDEPCSNPNCLDLSCARRNILGASPSSSSRILSVAMRRATAEPSSAAPPRRGT
eukprot:CAMPEP_0185428094 /NCGR_PEP_ID=MMETSP1365-20130426/15879_1 /TAXON_ID=38817 /ORGANISM="Gephyrocapsa oceanica, Strain RCC1303" /LENGTH=72 /DNA_ID=CAMNT_0028032263 /DNA_START=46 /DNA_END=260 /DNA_ORIENTATION=-